MAENDTLGAELPSIEQVTDRMLSRALTRATSKREEFRRTGIDSLDRDFKGWLSNGETAVLAARPGVGKSAIAQQIAEHVADPRRPEHERYSVLFFSCEMTTDALIQRGISRRTGMSTNKLKELPHGWTDDDYSSFRAAIKDVNQLALRISDRDYTIDAIDARAKKQAKLLTAGKGAPLGLIVVDYVQKIEVPRSADARHERIGEVSKVLTRLAKTLHVPLLALAQLGRPKMERGRSKGFTLDDIADSDSIARDAESVLSMEWVSETERKITGLKGRNIPAGRELRLRYEFERFHFSSLEQVRKSGA